MLEHFGRNLRKIRRDQDLSQATLALMIGRRQQEVSAVERGLRPSLPLVQRLARVLDVTVAELLREPPDFRKGVGRGDISVSDDASMLV